MNATIRRAAALPFALALVLALGCDGDDSSEPEADTSVDDDAEVVEADGSGEPDVDEDTVDDTGEDTSDDDATDSADAASEDTGPEMVGEGPDYDPTMVVPTSELGEVRGYALRMGHAHVHTALSHDACDELGIVDGVINEECVQDLRDGFCQTAMDWVFVTDHRASYIDYEYPDVLLHRDGDEYVMRDGREVANRIVCPDGHEVMMIVGVDTDVLTFGLDAHLRDTPEERNEIYYGRSVESIEAMAAAGGIPTAGYINEWDDEEQLLSLPFRGMEIYNTATNLRQNIGAVAEAAIGSINQPEEYPVPELSILPVFAENGEAMRLWSAFLQRRPGVSFLGVNAHRNTFTYEMQDGERLDSYRRLFHWFGNYVLVDPDTEPDDRFYIDAFASGRHYAAMTFLGYPKGFDFYAEQGEATLDMGANVALEPEVVLHVAVPDLYGRVPADSVPEVTARLLQATEDGWEVVASGAEDFTHTVTEAGIFRADVLMTPHHLLPWLGNQGERFVRELPWIWSNPITVGIEYEE